MELILISAPKFGVDSSISKMLKLNVPAVTLKRIALVAAFSWSHDFLMAAAMVGMY